MRRLLLSAAALLCLLAAALPLSASAETAGTAIPAPVVREAAYDPAGGILTIVVSNPGGIAVTGMEIQLHPLDGDGNPVLIGDGVIEDIPLEHRIIHSSALLEPGKDTTVLAGCGTDYPAAVGMAFAIDRVETTAFDSDGAPGEKASAEWPDDRLAWYSTLRNAYENEPESAEPLPPAEEAPEAAGKARLGVTVLPVPAKLAEAYGLSRGGLLVTAVDPGSPAGRMGLQVWDLIIQINETDYESEPRMMALAAADWSAGKPVEMLLQRDNEFWELSLTAAGGEP